MRAMGTLAVLGLAFALTSASAHSQVRDTATADALFREARALMKGGDFKKACPKLFESQRLDPAPGTAINLGDCWEKVGKLADALQSYRDALDLLKPGDNRLGPVKEQIASLDKRVPKLTIVLAPSSPAGTKVKRDDVELGEGSLGVALPVNPGEHWVVVMAPGRAEARRKVKVAEGQRREYLAHPGSAPATAAASDGDTPHPDSQPVVAEPPGAAEDHSGRTTWAWVAGGVSVAGLGAGLLFSKFANDEEKRAEDKVAGLPVDYCSKNPNASACADAADARDKRDTNRTVSTGAYIVGVIGAVAAVTLLIWPQDDGHQPAAAATLSVRFGPGSAQLHGRF